MVTRVLPVNDASLAEASRILSAGGLVGMPTETVYGLAANAFDENAVRSIFEAKGRPGDNPLIVHIHAFEQLADVIAGAPNDMAQKLMRAYWPGPMTLILPKGDKIPYAVTAGLETVAVRMPSHRDARALLIACGLPLAAPSANLSGKPSPTTAAHVFGDMNGRIPLILDGGACGVGLESTVVDVTGDTARVLRPGGVTPEMIEAALGRVELDDSLLRPLKAGEKPRSPGMKYRHYAPEGHVVIVRGAEDRVAARIRARYDESPSDSAILCLSGNARLYGDRFRIELGDTASDVANRLFAALRSLDDAHKMRIFAESVDAKGVGLAVMNRLGRAAAFEIENV